MYMNLEEMNHNLGSNDCILIIYFPWILWEKNHYLGNDVPEKWVKEFGGNSHFSLVFLGFFHFSSLKRT